MRRYKQYRPAVEVDQYSESDSRLSTSAKRKRKSSKAWLWTLGLIAALCLAVYAARNVVANILPESLVGGFCSVTGCVPAEPRKDVSQLQTMRKRLFAHPEIENALVISIDILNNSVYKQPFPTLAVTLLDAEGTNIAERKFSRVNYELVDRNQSEFLLPGEPTRIKIELVDSGLGASDMNLKFE